MAQEQRLTPAEWEIMETVWKLGGAPSVRDVLESAFPNGEKAYTTVQTIMNTLMKKKILSRKKIGMVNFYTPLKPRKQMLGAETSRLVSDFFKGSVPAFANYLFSSSEIDLEEIAAIRAMLEAREAELAGGTDND